MEEPADYARFLRKPVWTEQSPDTEYCNQDRLLQDSVERYQGARSKDEVGNEYSYQHQGPSAEARKFQEWNWDNQRHSAESYTEAGSDQNLTMGYQNTGSRVEESEYDEGGEDEVEGYIYEDKDNLEELLIETDSIYEPLRYPTPPGMSEAAMADRRRLRTRLRGQCRRAAREALEAVDESLRRQTTHEANLEYQRNRHLFVPGLPNLKAQLEGRAAPTSSAINPYGIRPRTSRRVLSIGERRPVSRADSNTRHNSVSEAARQYASITPASSLHLNSNNSSERSQASDFEFNANHQEPAIEVNNIVNWQSTPTIASHHVRSQPLTSTESLTYSPRIRSRTNVAGANPHVQSRVSTCGITKRYRAASRTAKMPAGGFAPSSLRSRLPYGRSITSSPRAGHGPMPPPLTNMSWRAASKLIPTALKQGQPEISEPSTDGAMMEDATGTQPVNFPEEPEGLEYEDDLGLPFPAPKIDIGHILQTKTLDDMKATMSQSLPPNIWPGHLVIVHPALPQQHLGIDKVFEWMGDTVDARYQNILMVHKFELRDYTERLILEIHEKLCHSYNNFYNDRWEKRFNQAMTPYGYGVLQSELNAARSRIADLEGKTSLQEHAFQNKLRSGYRYGERSEFRTFGGPHNKDGQDTYDHPNFFFPETAFPEAEANEGTAAPLNQKNLTVLQNMLLHDLVAPPASAGTAVHYGMRRSESAPLLGDMEDLGAPRVESEAQEANSERDYFSDEADINIEDWNVNMRGGAGSVYSENFNIDDDEDEEETGTLSNYSVPAQWANYTTQAQNRTSIPAASHVSSSDRSDTSQARSVFAGPAPKVDAYAPLNSTNDEYSLSIHRPDQTTLVAKPTWTTMDPKTRRRTYSEYSTDKESESGQSQAKVPSTIDPESQENGALAATFRSSSVYTSLDSSSGASTLLGAPNVRFATPSSVSTPLDPRLEDVTLDIDEGVRENFLPITELSTAQRPRTIAEQLNPSLAFHSAAPIINVFSSGSTSTYTSKVDPRVNDLDRHGNRIGNVEQQGQVKKRYREHHLKLVKERDEQMLRATAEKRAWEAMDPQERAERLAILRQPVKFWHGQPGAALEDSFDLDAIPNVYTQAVSTEYIETWMQCVQIETTDENHNDSFFVEAWDDDADISNASASNTQSPRGASSRTPAQIIHLASSLRAVNLEPRSLRSRDAPTSTSKHLYGASGASDNDSLHQGINDLAILDDSPVVRTIQDTEIELHEGPIPNEISTKFDSLVANAHVSGRLVAVTLNPLVKYTPAAIIKRVFGGVVQDIQFYEAKRQAVIVFLHCAEAEAFVHHVKKIKKSGTAQEFRALQIDVDWYQGSEQLSIQKPQANITRNYFCAAATRVLILQNIPLGKKKETVNLELGLRLNQLLVSVSLVTPKQRHLQQQQGKTAIIEFTSIKDAIEARNAILAGKIEEYEASDPSFASDPAGHPDVVRDYCHCKGCNDRRALRT